MKSGLIWTLVLLSSINVFASKARVGALQGADHIVDTQTVLTNPAHLNELPQFLTFEMGAAGSGAEGGFSRKLSNGNVLGVYLGHDNTNDLRDGTTYLKQQNPVEVIYGMGSQAFGASISTVDNKKSGTKETTFVGKYGFSSKAMEYYAHLALISTATKKATPDQKITTAPYLTLGGDFDSNANHFYGSIVFGQAKTETATTVNTKDTGITLGWEDRSLKTTDADIYYGANLNSVTRDIEGKKKSAMNLPIFVGLELNLNSWSIFRGSLSQNLLFGSVKDETATNTDADGINSNTTVSAGLGFKHSGLTVDGLLAASTTGQINGTAFMTSAAVTYNF